MGGPKESLTVIRFPQWTLIMKILHIDSYKVPTVDCHIVHVGDGMSLPPKIRDLIFLAYIENFYVYDVIL